TGRRPGDRVLPPPPHRPRPPCLLRCRRGGRGGRRGAGAPAGARRSRPADRRGLPRLRPRPRPPAHGAGRRMSGTLRECGDDVVQAALERALSEARGATVAVTRFSRRPFAYETSFALDSLDVQLGGGERLALLAKDVGPGGLSPGAAAAKPSHTLDPDREIAVYRDLLEPAALSTPRFHGAAVDPDLGRWWLFLERIDGEVLTDVGEVPVWCDAAAWAARLGDLVGPEVPLLYPDSAWHRHWIGAAIVRLREGGAADRATAEALDRHGSEVVDRLLALPQAFVHGELYPANVLVERAEEGPARIAPVDWELAGTGPYA